MKDETRDSVDACLTQAFRDVSVPDGLAERLLAGLAVKQPRRRRRWLTAVGGALTAAAAILFAIWLNAPADQPLSETDICGIAIQSFDEPSNHPAYSLAKQPAPSSFPFSQHVLCVSQASWRKVDDFLGGQGVAYDLPGPGTVRATLYVVALGNVAGLNGRPARDPACDTAGCCAAAWQEGQLLYVLVVQGDTSTYQGYLNLPRSPVA
jgi:hypothetical protein